MTSEKLSDRLRFLEDELKSDQDWERLEKVQGIRQGVEALKAKIKRLTEQKFCEIKNSPAINQLIENVDKQNEFLKSKLQDAESRLVKAQELIEKWRIAYDKSGGTYLPNSLQCADELEEALGE